MPIPTTDQQKILDHLGYSDPTGLLPVVTPTIMSIVTQLTVIDSQLESARGDSMATQVDQLKVDFPRHIQLLKQEGIRLLRQLASLSGTPVHFDKYLGRSPNDISRSPLAIPSYW